ncbi:enoyl-CoA hydratase [Mycolicibacterium mageritense DSM 44476 = CIP 104973]|uniref:Enoyl-CoA hydratase n=1 Tax=Mycolicibacterium mageritense TaxID=53462 RepID=A0AAI8XML3_MYCME|nr:enoyl-CoA hydratase [Mycolicibacterium mageritense]BDY30759.1 putative enoyl-CoA hydratase echA8 [Mycolicibacterium mageritense]GJJ17559.1 enoyl-CoA hydratase [Mycolicibacterium mageritense]CDO19619.1 enoyl-CoA hydratase [Mycolicibacterium mageritense DSM 44476 = CIP 104973]
MAADTSLGDEVATEAVRYDVVSGSVAVITLNRPERLNSWGADISAGVYANFDRAEADPAIRAIVLTGSGKGFCAGAYMGSMAALGESIDGDTDVSKIVGERHPHFLTALRKPVIAAINGACVGIGLTHALMCDVRFAAAGAKFATAFPRRGLIGEYGITWILPRLAGWGAAADLLLSGRTFLAEEAVQLGLVKEVVAPDDLLARAVEYAEDLARNCSPASMAVIKRQLYGDANDAVVDVSARAETLMHESMVRPDLVEGITAFFEKRPPDFPPLKEGC